MTYDEIALRERLQGFPLEARAELLHVLRLLTSTAPSIGDRGPASVWLATTAS